MQKLEAARDQIASVLQDKRTAIALSFGKDSMLTAALVLQQAPDTTCIWLHQCLTKQQQMFPERVMVEWGLTVWSCGIQDWQVIEHQNNYYAAFRYSLNGESLTTIFDVIHEPNAPCVFHLRPRLSPAITLPVEAIFTGWRKEDAHPLMPQEMPARIGNMELISPLADWTDEEVWEATRSLNIPFNASKYAGNEMADPDNLIANLNCLRQGACTCRI